MTVVLLHSFPAVSVTAGAREPGGGKAQGGGTEEEVWGEGETDPQSAREPERAANPAAAAGERLSCTQPLQGVATRQGTFCDKSIFMCFKKFSSFLSLYRDIHEMRSDLQRWRFRITFSAAQAWTDCRQINVKAAAAPGEARRVWWVWWVKSIFSLTLRLEQKRLRTLIQPQLSAVISE